MSSPNQYWVTRKSDIEKDAAHPYARVNVKAMRDAMANLKEYEFKLYLLLSMNQYDYKMEMSPQDYANECGGCKRSWQNARDGLKEKGYLVEKSGNQFEFYETPISEARTFTFKDF